MRAAWMAPGCLVLSALMGLLTIGIIAHFCMREAPLRWRLWLQKKAQPFVQEALRCSAAKLEAERKMWTSDLQAMRFQLAAAARLGLCSDCVSESASDESLADRCACCGTTIAAWASPGAALILAERDRQVCEAGWDALHDDGQIAGQLAWAAACYAAPSAIVDSLTGLNVWPWDTAADKRPKHDRIRQLSIAGALCAAEIDRLLRRGNSTSDVCGKEHSSMGAAPLTTPTRAVDSERTAAQRPPTTEGSTP